MLQVLKDLHRLNVMIYRSKLMEVTCDHQEMLKLVKRRSRPRSAFIFVGYKSSAAPKHTLSTGGHSFHQEEDRHPLRERKVRFDGLPPPVSQARKLARFSLSCDEASSATRYLPTAAFETSRGVRGEHREVAPVGGGIEA